MAFDGSRQSVNVFETLAWAGTSFTLLVLLAGLWALNSAQADSRQRVTELLDATPGLMWQSILGKWLGMVLLAALQLVVFIGVLTVKAIASGGSLSLATISAFYFIIYLPWLLMAITIGFVTGTHIKSFFASIPIVAAWWAVMMAGVDSGILSRRLPGPWAEIIDITGMLPVTTSAVFGFLPLYRLLLNRLMQFSIMLLILTLSMLFYKRQRENKPSLQIVVASCMALLLAITGVLQFYQDINCIKASTMARFVNPNDFQQGAITMYPQWASLASDHPLNVSEHSLELQFNQTAKSLTGKSTITVFNPTAKPIDKFVFTLNQNLKINSITIDSSSVSPDVTPFGWYAVELPSPLPPHETAVVIMDYSGKIEEWTFRFDGRDPELIAFINRQGIFLPATFYWYPQAGAHEVYGLLPIGKSPLPPAQFTISISGIEQEVAINLPRTEQAWHGQTQSVDLVAGNYRSVQHENVTLMYTNGHTQEAQDVAQRLKIMYDLWTLHLGPSSHTNITVVTIPSKFYGNLSPQRSGTLTITDSTVATQRINIHDLWNNQSLFSAMATLWFYSGYDYSAPGESRDAAIGVVSYLWSLYRDQLVQENNIHAERDARVARGWLPSGQQWSISSDDINQIWLELYQLYHDDLALFQGRLQELFALIKAGGR